MLNYSLNDDNTFQYKNTNKNKNKSSRIQYPMDKMNCWIVLNVYPLRDMAESGCKSREAVMKDNTPDETLSTKNEGQPGNIFQHQYKPFVMMKRPWDMSPSGYKKINKYLKEYNKELRNKDITGVESDHEMDVDIVNTLVNNLVRLNIGHTQGNCKGCRRLELNDMFEVGKKPYIKLNMTRVDPIIGVSVERLVRTTDNANRTTYRQPPIYYGQTHDLRTQTHNRYSREFDSDNEDYGLPPPGAPTHNRLSEKLESDNEDSESHVKGHGTMTCETQQKK